MQQGRDMQYEFGKDLAQAHLEASFDKYIVIGYSLDKGDEILTNCDREQLELLTALLLENLKTK